MPKYTPIFFHFLFYKLTLLVAIPAIDIFLMQETIMSNDNCFKYCTSHKKMTTVKHGSFRQHTHYEFCRCLKTGARLLLKIVYCKSSVAFKYWNLPCQDILCTCSVHRYNGNWTLQLYALLYFSTLFSKFYSTAMTFQIIFGIDHLGGL